MGDILAEIAAEITHGILFHGPEREFESRNPASESGFEPPFVDVSFENRSDKSVRLVGGMDDIPKTVAPKQKITWKTAHRRIGKGIEAKFAVDGGGLIVISWKTEPWLLWGKETSYHTDFSENLYVSQDGGGTDGKPANIVLERTGNFHPPLPTIRLTTRISGDQTIPRRHAARRQRIRSGRQVSPKDARRRRSSIHLSQRLASAREHEGEQAHLGEMDSWTKEQRH
jgi:hypothetical protein